MNIFNHYGIKEVADVTFYSISQVGDEKFYTPVLFFDTLKVSTTSQSNDTVTASGGKGNRKVISWSWNKEIKMSLEDALFSKASMNIFMNGRLESKLSNWTSAIAKLNTANKYGRLHYSTKAYPSPTLTMAEWEIVFRCAEKAGYSAEFGDQSIEKEDYAKYCKYQFDTIAGDSEKDSYVAENRKFLTQKYMLRNQMSPKSYNIGYYYDFEEGYSGVDIRIVYKSWVADNINTQEHFEYVSQDSFDDAQLALINYLKEVQSQANVNKQYENVKITVPIVIRYNYNNEIYFDNTSASIEIWLAALPHQGFYCRATNIVSSQKNVVAMFDNTYCGYDVFNNHIFYYLFPTKLSDFMDLCYCDLQDQFFLAMPQIVIKEIEKEIDTVRKIGYIESDLHSAPYIDRFESCIVKKQSGFTIDALEQRRNVERKYNNDISSSYTIYYDPKTMLPLFTNNEYVTQPHSKRYIKLNNCEFTISSSPDIYTILASGLSLTTLLSSNFDTIKKMIIDQGETDIDYIEDILFVGDPSSIVLMGNTISFQGESPPLLVKYTTINPNLFKLKRGTRYLKWTRTIDEDGSLFTDVGTDLIIDANTFSGEYMVVGETYVREQKTGRDQRCQLVFPRVKISSETEIKLEAAGEPVTFSLDVDVLAEKGKEMMKMTFFDVEEDKTEGGFKIVPQNMRYSYTPFAQDQEDFVIDNNEIY